MASQLVLAARTGLRGVGTQRSVSIVESAGVGLSQTVELGSQRFLTPHHHEDRNAPARPAAFWGPHDG